MGNSSGFMAVKGVPMPPTAWALASMWADIWDAPRFRGSGQVHKPALSREALAPLLKIAASCVAALQPHVQVPGKLSVPLQGGSRELLVAAIDGDVDGAALSDPSENPSGFVRQLVKSAFMTGDLEFPDGTSEALLDKLIDKHCRSQLEQSALLVTDPSAALASTLDAVRQVVQEVVSARPKEGDLGGVASRLLLIQRLERVMEDAQAIMATASEPSEVPTEPSAALDTETSQIKNETEANDTDQPPLKRTKSQTAAKLQVQKVQQHTENLAKEIHVLSRTTSVLAKHEVPEDEKDSLRTELKSVEEARKKARNFGEDLLEDMMQLDNLSGLADTDRSVRKSTLSGLEGLLQDVDTAKSRLAFMHKELNEKLRKIEAIDDANSKGAAADAQAHQAQAPLPSPSRRAEQGRAAAESALEPPPPGKDVWKQVRLRLRFQTHEEPSCYTISATIPGLDLDDLKLDLSDSSTALHVEGLRVPSKQEGVSMRTKIAQRIKSVAQRSPSQFQKLMDRLPQAARDAYVELGQGEFGRFADTFKLPGDVDVDKIDASYTDGVLRIVLPKKIPQMPHRSGYSSRQPPEYGSDRYLGGRTPGRRELYPGLGPAGDAPWGGSLFGGHDDYFRW